ncbi:MAG: hypothetical protein Kow00107_05040 [Planctomycetota bacterium]
MMGFSDIVHLRIGTAGRRRTTCFSGRKREKASAGARHSPKLSASRF